MKWISRIVLFTGWMLAATAAMAQDTLPKFSVEDRGGGRVVVSWRNPYPNLIQLAVQRSYDSTKKFTTVYSSTSPELPVNGYSDKIIPGIKYYYRVFYVMEGGAYFFTKSMRPSAPIIVPRDSTGSNTNNGKKDSVVVVDNKRDQLDEELVKKLKKGYKKEDEEEVIPPDKPFYIKVKDTLYTTLITAEFFRFRDSIMKQTKDTLFQLTDDTILLGIYVPPFLQRTSEFVFTDRDGYIVIKLPDAATKRYDIKFMEEDETLVLELKALKEPFLILDKTNFYHGGWYKFELLENGKIKERNRIFLARDFSP